LKKVISLCVLIILGCNFLHAQLAPKYSNEFLAVGVGARNAGMGDAIISNINDVTSGYWNPAGLVDIKDNVQVSLMHNEQFAGIGKHDYGAASLKLNDNSTIALSVIRYGVDDIPNTLNLIQNGQIDYSRITNFSTVDWGFIGSYATRTKIEGLNIGANVKVIRRVVGEFANSWGFGLDLGAQYKLKDWMFGLMVRDITSTFNVWSFTFTPEQKQVLLASQNELPHNTLELTVPKIIFGVSRKWMLFNNKFSVLPAIDFDYSTDGQRNVAIHSKYFNLDPKIGLEIGYANIVFLRGGMNNFQQQKDITGKVSTAFTPVVGVGLKLNNLSIDYALSNAGGVAATPYSNIISLRLNINKKG